MTDDTDPLEILNAIDRERGDSFIGMIQANQVQRLRDEIVTLRQQQEAVRGIAGNERRLSEAIAQQARDEALDEAARIALRWQNTACGEFDRALAIATAIRALKERRDG